MISEDLISDSRRQLERFQTAMKERAAKLIAMFQNATDESVKDAAAATMEVIIAAEEIEACLIAMLRQVAKP